MLDIKMPKKFKGKLHLSGEVTIKHIYVPIPPVTPIAKYRFKPTLSLIDNFKIQTFMSDLVITKKSNQGFDLDLGTPVDAAGLSSGTFKEGSIKVEVVTEGVVVASDYDPATNKIHFSKGSVEGSTQVNLTATVTPDDDGEEEEEISEFFTVINQSGKTSGFKLSATEPVDEPA